MAPAHQPSMTAQPIVPNRDQSGRFAETERSETPSAALIDATVVEERLSDAYSTIDAGEFKPWDGANPQPDPIDPTEVRAGLRKVFSRLDDDQFDTHVTPVMGALAKINELNEEEPDDIARWDHLREEAGVEFGNSAPVTNYGGMDQPADEDDLETAYRETYGYFEGRLIDATEALEAADRSA